MERRWIWPFELLDKLGEGGMGVVYRARYVKNDRIVAVKLLPDSVKDPALLARFEREMQILKTLRHPHIVHTFGGQAEGDVRFYAMELVDGGTLDDLLHERGRLPVGVVAEYAVQICSALAYAHEKGIVHRDLKPANFLIAKDGKLKLADFGLATFAAANKLTATGRTMGTMRYMAPEQIRGKPDPCAQTDLYALGVVLFELLTGRPPFEADTPAAVLHMHLKDMPPRVSDTAPHVPAALDDLVARLLRKKIEDRPSGAAEVGVALRGLEETVEVATRRTIAGGFPLTEPKPVATDPAKSSAAPSSGAVAVPRRRGGLPWWAAAGPGAVALLALSWGCSLRDQAEGLERVESRWIDVLANGDLQHKAFAAEALGVVGPSGSRAEAALIDALKDSEPSVRAAAATALGTFGEEGKGASGDLRRLAQKDDRPEVRQAAVEALRQITGQTPQ